MNLNNSSTSNLSSSLSSGLSNLKDLTDINIKETSIYCLISKGYLCFLPLKLGTNKIRIKEKFNKFTNNNSNKANNDNEAQLKQTTVEVNGTNVLHANDLSTRNGAASIVSSTPPNNENILNPDFATPTPTPTPQPVNYINSNGEYSKDLLSAVKDNDYYYSHFLTNKSVSSLNGSIYGTPKSSSVILDIHSDISHSEDDETCSYEQDQVYNSNLTDLLNNYSSHSIYLPNHFIEPSINSTNLNLKEMLYEIFPHWEINNEDIKITQLTGGITNMLLSCSKFNKETNNNEKILVRSYGRGTSLIIDRDREFVSHLVLNSFNLAPPIHCRFGNGLVYGYLKGRSISPDEMALPFIYPFVAQRLGQWHELIKADLIDESVLKLKKFNQNVIKGSGKQDDSHDTNTDNSTDIDFIKDIWTLIKDWIKVVPEIDGLVKVCEDNKDIQEPFTPTSSLSSSPNLKQILVNELEWLYKEIGDKSPIVVSHCDLLSGNIIIPKDPSFIKQFDLSKDANKQLPPIESNPISFIDYEYMMPAPRAFDISNHFMEWQGFDCNKANIPVPSIDNIVMKNWAKSYLHLNQEGQDNQILEDQESAIKQLIDEIYLYYGLPGFYWGVWAGIQSNISLIDFDYSTYSGLRLNEYWEWKRSYLKSRNSN